MAPITKKPATTGSSTKAGTGSLGKSSSSISKSNSMSGSGKSTSALGSSTKSNKLMSSGSGYTPKSSSSSFMGSSVKNDSLLGSSAKKVMPPSIKSMESSVKTSNTFGSGGKTASFMGYSAKSDSVMGTSGKNKVSSPPEKSGIISQSGKTSNTVGSTDKNKFSGFSGKTTPEPSKEYPSFINPLGSKTKTRIGLIWIPTRKRNKKKDMVFNSHNYERYKEKGPSMYSYMSGDSSTYQQPHKKKEEEANLLVPERPKLTTVAVNTGITAATIDLPSDDSALNKPEEKQEFIKRDNEENKEAAGDTNERATRNDSDYLENKTNDAKSQDSKWDKDKEGDKVDSVYLRPPPPHKTRSAASTNDDEDCGIKCLYYTLQCCDCVLM